MKIKQETVTVSVSDGKMTCYGCQAPVPKGDKIFIVVDQGRPGKTINLCMRHAQRLVAAIEAREGKEALDKKPI